MSDSLNYCPTARKEDILAHDVGNEVVIYDLKDDKAYCLNRVAAKVWKHCDGQTPISKLAGLLDEFGVPAEPVGVLSVLEQLTEYNLLDSNGPKPKKVSRRDVLARLGVAAAVVLVSVSVINAPTASQAASTGLTGPVGSH
jgi:Coenzyme PQQ synthesis protein D (PqqD)